jgi:hypothetical protein
MATSPARPAIVAPAAQAAAVTTTLTMSMTVYPCGNVTAAPDRWMLVVSAGRKETAGRRAPGAWRGQPGRACSGVDVEPTRVRVSTWVIGLPFLGYRPSGCPAAGLLIGP